MRKGLLLLSVLLLVLSSSLAFAYACDGDKQYFTPARNWLLAADGKTQYVIVVDSVASASELHAARELAAMLKQATGAEFTQCTPEDAGNRPRIAVGAGAARSTLPNIDLNGLGADGVLIKSVSSHIILTGGPGAPRGTLYAVYTFLEDQVGFRWWTRSETTVPERSVLAIPSSLNVRYVPPLERRESFYVESFDADFAVRTKNNGYWIPDEVRGGNLGYAVSAAHTFSVMVPPEEYFDKHPDWFSEINGVRKSDHSQLCLTNPEVLQVVIGKAKEWLRANPNDEFVSITQNDWHGWCTCANCKAVDEAEGSQSGTMIRFVNAVAEAIEPEFPNAFVDTFAYEYTRKAPKITKPRKNVVVRLCSIECNFSKPLENKSNEAFRKDIEDWAKITDRLYVWDYVTNFSHYLRPHPNLRVIGPNVRFYVRNHVKGLFEQGNHQSPGGELAGLRNWVLAKLLWNPNLDEKALIRQFLEGYYGPAAPYLHRYIELMHDTVDRTDYYMGISDKRSSRSPAPYLAPEILDKATALFSQARSAVAGKPEYLHRVEVAEMSILYARIERLQAQFQRDGKLDSVQELNSLLDRFTMIADREQITRVAENGDSPQQWAKRIRRMASDNGIRQVTRTVDSHKGKIMVVRLATAWKFSPDPEKTGVTAGWFGTDFDDSKWAMNRTDFGCGWEKQGFSGYTGFGWYRQSFNTPADLRQKHRYLYFGAVDEEAWVYLNGGSTPVFEHTCASTKIASNQIWRTPFLIDIADCLQTEQKNLLSVRVYNARAMGGIWQPVYLIASDTELTAQDANDAVKQAMEN